MTSQESTEKRNDEEQFKQASIAYIQKLKNDRGKVNPQRYLPQL
jgi:hypothetical protein